MKSFVLSEDHTLLLDLARDLASIEIRSASEAVDHQKMPPQNGMSALAGSGLLACTVPEQLGGSELDYFSQILVIQEIAKECASTAWAVALSAEVAECLLRSGTDTQKALILPQLTAGAFAAAATESCVQAEPFENGFRLSGRVSHVPLAQSCAWYLLSASQKEDTRWFLVEQGCAGLTVTPEAELLGMKGCPMGTLRLENCQVSGERLVEASLNTTLKEAKALNMAAIASGIAQGALSEAIAYVNQRVQFGKTIAQFENTQQVMAQLLATADAARALVWDAARVKDSGADYGVAAAMAKCVAADAASMITRKCVQFMGGYGYSREYPVERKMRDAKMTELLGGPTAALQEQVAGALVVQN